MYCKIVHIFCVLKTLLEVWYLALRTGKVIDTISVFKISASSKLTVARNKCCTR